MVREIRIGEKISREELKRYHDMLYAAYSDALGSDKDALFKMKEVWSYLGNRFSDADRYLKKIRKADRPEEYLSAVKGIFECCRIDMQ